MLFQGQYNFYPNGDAVEINVSTTSGHPPLTLAHEIGHFIDHQALGDIGLFASKDSPMLEGWRNAIAVSAATKALEDLLNDAYYKKLSTHYLSKEEQWARSYAQWVAIRSKNTKLIKQYKAIIKSSNKAVSASQWIGVDFNPVAAEIDALFKKLGWLK